MYFDFEDHRPDTPSIPRPMSLREVVLITVNLHLVVLVAILLGPQVPFVKRIIEARQAEVEAAQQEQQRKLEEQRERPRFVFMQPRMERPVPPPPRAEMSDIDRRARSVERAPDPRNPLPFSRGNTTERIDAAPDPKPSPPSPGKPRRRRRQPQASPLPAPDGPNGFSRSQEPQRPQKHLERASCPTPSRTCRSTPRRKASSTFRAGQNQEFGPVHQLRFEGRRVRPVDRPLRRAGAPQLVHSDGGDDRCAGTSW
jgi:hypothetical protein